MRGMAAKIVSSLMIFPNDFLNELRCMLRACCMISLTRVLLCLSARIASFLQENSFMPNPIPPYLKSILAMAYCPSGSSAESI